MSNFPKLVLTRPEAAAHRLLTQVETVLGQDVPHVISPILKIRPVGIWPDLPSDTEVILTSEHAVRGDLNGVTTHCVGARTAEAVAAKGACIQTLAENADELMGALRTRQANYLHICGSHKAVDITAQLAALGLLCRDHQVYEQQAQPLTDDALSALEGEDPALLPLFSPRSARLVGEAIAKPGLQLQVIAMSKAIAADWHAATGKPADVIDTPTGDAMVRGIVAALRGYAA